MPENSHHEEGCTICDKSFVNGETSEIHAKKNSHKKKKRKLFCTICKDQFTTGYEFIQHTVSAKHLTNLEIKNSQGYSLFCNLCHVQCLTPTQFGQHMLSKGHVKKSSISNVDQKWPILNELIKLITTVLNNECFPYEEGLEFIRKVNIDLMVLIEQYHITSNLNNASIQLSTGAVVNDENCDNLNNDTPINCDINYTNENSKLNNDEASKERNVIINSTADITEPKEFCSKDAFIYDGNCKSLNNDETINDDNNETSEYDNTNLNKDENRIKSTKGGFVEASKTNDMNGTLKSNIEQELNEKSNWEYNFSLKNIQDIPKLLAVIRMELYYLKLIKTETKRISILRQLEDLVNMIHTNTVPDRETLALLVEWNSKLQKTIKSRQTVVG